MSSKQYHLLALTSLFCSLFPHWWCVAPTLVFRQIPGWMTIWTGLTPAQNVVVGTPPQTISESSVLHMNVRITALKHTRCFGSQIEFFFYQNRNPFSFISKQLLWNVFGTAFPTVKTLYGPVCNNSISTWKSFWTTGPTWSVLKGTLRHCANTIIQTPANNALIKKNISSHSGLGAYDKAVVIGEDGEILGEQILFLTF